MRNFLTGLGALLLMTGQCLLAQPALFSANGRGGAAARTAKANQRTRRVTANPKVLKDAESVSLNLFDDRQFSVNKTHASDENGVTIWHGEIAGTTGSDVTLVVDGDRITGSIRSADGKFYTVQPETDGTHSIAEVDPTAAQTDDVALEPPAEFLVETEAKAGVQRAAASLSSLALAASQSTVDVLVVYTAEARAAAGSTANIVNKIQLAVAEANQGLVNSGINMQLRLVGTSESAPSAGQAASTTYLSQMTGNATIAALRNQYGADMVSVWVNGPGAGGGVVGIGWIQTSPSANFQSAAYSVVEVNFAAGPYYSFIHELGHNLGGAHDRANATGPGAFPYAYGFQSQPGSFVDIMAYTNGCSGCSRIPYFSNPDVSYGGFATGVLSTAANAADLRLTINATRVFAEQWRASLVSSSIPPPAALAPTITSVTPSAGTGASTVLTANYADGNGAGDVATVYLSVQSGSTANACYVSVAPATGAVQLRNNADNAWTGGLTIGQAGSLSNSQCTVSGSGSSLTANGNALALTLPVAFASAFAGTKDLYLKADDAGGLTSNWQKAGTWTIPAAVIPPTPPSFSSLSPMIGSGSSATFSAVFTDPNGAFEISRTLIIINKQLSPVGGCYIYVYPPSHQYYMLNATASAWIGPVNFGSDTATNGNCTIGSAASATASGSTLSVTLPIQFGAGFTGAKNIYTDAADQNGIWIPWITAGTFTVK